MDSTQLYYGYLYLSIPQNLNYMYIELKVKLPFHPNLSDKLHIAHYICKITEIGYYPDNAKICLGLSLLNGEFRLYTKAQDEKIHEFFRNEFKEIKKWAQDNNIEIKLLDFTLNPTVPFEENGFITPIGIPKHLVNEKDITYQPLCSLNVLAED